MQYIVDLHSHSRYSRACSAKLELPNIARACEEKGIQIVGMSDVTHPKWFSHCKESLKEVDEGLYALKEGTSPTRFVCATEISCIYKQGGATRRVHVLVFAPNLETVEKINKTLSDRGCNIVADGRPIIGLSAKELLQVIKEISPLCYMIPAHAWTPWFAVFGSKSGFNSLEECFEELTPEIFAIETGLSSDTHMNGMISGLDGITLISNSDAHGLENFGREANVFEMERPNYGELFSVIKSNDPKKFLYTIEFYPEEGKYFLDGCAACSISMKPDETKKRGGRCSKCGKLVTVGVMSRVHDIADRSESKRTIPQKSIVPLKETIASMMQVGKASKKVELVYRTLLQELGSEFYILLDAPLEDIARVSSAPIAEGVRRVRTGDIFIKGGYDGVFGVVSVLRPGETLGTMQMSLL